MTTDNPLNPTVEICGKPLMSLTSFCHGAGTDVVAKAKAAGKSNEEANDAYLKAYYERLAKVAPSHPALKDYVP